MRKNLGGKPHGNTLRTLHEQQRELHGQRQRLALTAVVRHGPVRGLRIEHRFQGKLREARLDVTGCGRAVARQNVTPVTLRLHKQFLLSQLHERVADGGVTVRVVLHRIAHHVGYLVETAVVQLLHRVQDAPLYGLQPVVDVRHGTLQNNVGRIVEKPCAEHARQVSILFFGYNIRRVGLGGRFFRRFHHVVQFFCIIVIFHIAALNRHLPFLSRKNW